MFEVITKREYIDRIVTMPKKEVAARIGISQQSFDVTYKRPSSKLDLVYNIHKVHHKPFILLLFNYEYEYIDAASLILHIISASKITPAEFRQRGINLHYDLTNNTLTLKKLRKILEEVNQEVVVKVGQKFCILKD
tara:strand:- start:1582 stop:1989 length:408 start_codon:yes stop_codon:yes gene_type:complete